MLGGCGAARTAAPDVSVPQVPVGATAHVFAALGLTFSTASNWQYSAGAAPLVATTFSGQAQVALWRYPRVERLPHTSAQLRAARDALLGATRARDPGFVLLSAVITRVARHPAVMLVGRESVAGQLRTVRSVHVYAYGAELVIDAFAPPALFPMADRDLFVPLVGSVTLKAPPRSPPGAAAAAGRAP